MSFVPILESKSQNGTQIFKSLKMVPFFVKTSHVCPLTKNGTILRLLKMWIPFWDFDSKMETKKHN